MTREIKEQLDTICRIIQETVDVEKIYLFGSYAYGTPDKDSDLDIYVVIPDGGENPFDAMRDIVGAMFYRVDMPVDILADYAGRFPPPRPSSLKISQRRTLKKTALCLIRHPPLV